MDELPRMRPESKLSEFVSLPAEVIRHILQQLGNKVNSNLLINICCTCRRMREIAIDTRLVVSKTFKRVELVEKFKNNNWMINCSLSWSKIKDVSALGNVHTLRIYDCDEVVDVSNLGNVNTLYISFCKGVTDVSMLGNVHTLSLSNCEGVVDVSALGNVHALNLSWCKGVGDVSALGNVHTLNLSYCKGVIDVSSIEDKVRELISPNWEVIKNC